MKKRDGDSEAGCAALLTDFRTVFFRKIEVAEWTMKVHSGPQHMRIHDKYLFARRTCDFYCLAHRLPRNYFDFENSINHKEHIAAEPQPKIRNISRKACPEKSRRGRKAIVIRTWRSSRLGGRNLRVRDVLCGHKICFLCVLCGKTLLFSFYGSRAVTFWFYAVSSPFLRPVCGPVGWDMLQHLSGDILLQLNACHCLIRALGNR